MNNSKKMNKILIHLELREERGKRGPRLATEHQ
jgi:hypothetical protein